MEKLENRVIMVGELGLTILCILEYQPTPMSKDVDSGSLRRDYMYDVIYLHVTFLSKQSIFL